VVKNPEKPPKDPPPQLRIVVSCSECKATRVSERVPLRLLRWPGNGLDRCSVERVAAIFTRSTTLVHILDLPRVSSGETQKGYNQ
jgi:hypothetical protein